MSTADARSSSVLAINDGGLLLLRDNASTWLIKGSADGLTYGAEDRLVWLLPLLERSPADISAALAPVRLTDTPGGRSVACSTCWRR